MRTQTVRASPHRASCEEGEWQTRGLLASLTVGRRGSADGTCEIVRSERTGRAASGLAACTRHLATAAHVLRREVSILGHVAPVAAGAVDVEEEEYEAEGGAPKDGHGRPDLEALDEYHRDEHHGALGRVLAVLVEERDARSEDEPDGCGVHPDESTAHPRVLARRLPEGHEGIDEHDPRAEEAEKAEDDAGHGAGDGAKKGGEVEEGAGHRLGEGEAEGEPDQRPNQKVTCGRKWARGMWEEWVVWARGMWGE